MARVLVSLSNTVSLCKFCVYVSMYKDQCVCNTWIQWMCDLLELKNLHTRTHTHDLIGLKDCCLHAHTYTHTVREFSVE